MPDTNSVKKKMLPLIQLLWPLVPQLMSFWRFFTPLLSPPDVFSYRRTCYDQTTTTVIIGAQTYT